MGAEAGRKVSQCGTAAEAVPESGVLWPETGAAEEELSPVPESGTEGFISAVMLLTGSEDKILQVGEETAERADFGNVVFGDQRDFIYGFIFIGDEQFADFVAFEHGGFQRLVINDFGAVFAFAAFFNGPDDFFGNDGINGFDGAVPNGDFGHNLVLVKKLIVVEVGKTPGHQAFGFFGALFVAFQPGHHLNEAAVVPDGRTGQAETRFRRVAGFETVGAFEAVEQRVAVALAD